MSTCLGSNEFTNSLLVATQGNLVLKHAMAPGAPQASPAETVTIVPVFIYSIFSNTRAFRRLYG
jgi:hypothetical protein